MSLPNEYIGVPSRWAIHIDNIRLRWEASGNQMEGRRMREENSIWHGGGDTVPFTVVRL
jgi:hypothetical protein